jgi:hypothetical protein
MADDVHSRPNLPALAGFKPAALIEMLAAHWPALLLSIPLLLVLYGIILAIYRLYFSPIAGFPGPKIAAATAWYEFYYDVIKYGRYFYKIAQMHDKYGTPLDSRIDEKCAGVKVRLLTGTDATGPIVRINPWELSVRDPDFHGILYVAGSVRRSQIFPRSRAGIGIDGNGARPSVVMKLLGSSLR